jgi:purine-binding chemotaxis protein CheW
LKRAQTRRGPIDWTRVRERLDAARGRSEALFEISPERSRAILEERARKLACAPEAVDLGESHEVLAFALGPERYFIEMKYLREVVRFVDYTPVPGTPDFVVGVTNLRGEVVCVVDLRKFFGLPVRGLTDLSRAIALGVEVTEFAILADRVFDVGTMRARDILRSPESSGVGHDYLLGVTREAAIVLDGAALLRDPRLTIEHGESLNAGRRTRE